MLLGSDSWETRLMDFNNCQKRDQTMLVQNSEIGKCGYREILRASEIVRIFGSEIAVGNRIGEADREMLPFLLVLHLSPCPWAPVWGFSHAVGFPQSESL